MGKNHDKVNIADIERYGHINAAPVEFVNAIYSKTRVYYRRYNQLKAIIDMRVPLHTMEPIPKLKTLEDTQAFIVDELGISEEDALCMAECAMAIGKKQREVLDRDPDSPSKKLDQSVENLKKLLEESKT